MDDLLDHIINQINKLNSPDANTRYEGCEFLRAAPMITDDAKKALKNALKDPDKDVAYAAKRALEIHADDDVETISKQKKYETSSLEEESFTENSPIQEPNYSPVTQQMPSGSPNSPEYIFALEKRIMMLEAELQKQNWALKNVIRNVNTQFNKIPKSEIISENFLSRAFAVWGHYFVAQLLISIPVFIFYLILGILN